MIIIFAQLSPDGILDEETIGRGMTNLGRSADGSQQVYLHTAIPVITLIHFLCQILFLKNSSTFKDSSKIKLKLKVNDHLSFIFLSMIYLKKMNIIVIC